MTHEPCPRECFFPTPTSPAGRLRRGAIGLLLTLLIPALGGCMSQNAPPPGEHAQQASATLAPAGQTPIAAKTGQVGADASPVDMAFQ